MIYYCYIKEGLAEFMRFPNFGGEENNFVIRSMEPKPLLNGIKIPKGPVQNHETTLHQGRQNANAATCEAELIASYDGSIAFG